MLNQTLAVSYTAFILKGVLIQFIIQISMPNFCQFKSIGLDFNLALTIDIDALSKKKKS